MVEHTDKSSETKQAAKLNTESQTQDETTQQETMNYSKSFADGGGALPPPSNNGISSNGILQLQSMLGNQAVLQLLRDNRITPAQNGAAPIIQRDALDDFFALQNEAHKANKLTTKIDIPVGKMKGSFGLTIETKGGSQKKAMEEGVHGPKSKMGLPSGEGETATSREKKRGEKMGGAKSSMKYKIKSGIAASILNGVYRSDNLTLAAQLNVDGPAYEAAVDEKGTNKSKISFASVNVKVIGSMFNPSINSSYSIIGQAKMDMPLDMVKDLVKKGVAKRAAKVAAKDAPKVAKEMQKQAKEAAEMSKKRLTDQVKALDDELAKLKPGSKAYNNKLAEKTLAQFDVKDMDEFIQKVDSKEMLDAFQRHAKEELSDPDNYKKSSSVFKFLAKPMGKVMGSRLMKTAGRVLLKFVPGLNIVMTIIDIVEIGTAIYKLIKYGPGSGGSGGSGEGEEKQDGQASGSGGKGDKEGQGKTEGGTKSQTDAQKGTQPNAKGKPGKGGGSGQSENVPLNRSVKLILDTMKTEGDTAKGDKPFTPEQLKRLNKLIPDDLIDDTEKMKKLLDKLQSGDKQKGKGGATDPESVISMITQWLQKLDSKGTSDFDIIEIDYDRAIRANPIEQKILGWKTSDFTGRDDMSADSRPFASFIAAFQDRVGLKVDGIAGPNTTEAFFKEQKNTKSKVYKKAVKEISRRSQKKAKKGSSGAALIWKSYEGYFKQDKKTNEFSVNQSVVDKVKGITVEMGNGGQGQIQEVKIIPEDKGEWYVAIIYKVTKPPEGQEPLQDKVLSIEWSVWYNKDAKKLFGMTMNEPFEVDFETAPAN